MMFKSELKDESRRAFDELAPEYYDPILHPTCNNFRVASKSLLSEWISNKKFRDGVEVGCGASLLAEILVEQKKPLNSITLADISPSMLAHSIEYEPLGARLVVASSERLPLADASQDMLVSSLGDPYNDEGFWLEASRVLRKGGQLFFSTPSFEWSRSFRQSLPPVLQPKAEFITAMGRKVWIPSNIVSEKAQCIIIKQAGFNFISVKGISLHDIPPPLSSKLDMLDKTNVPIVTAFFAERL